MATESKAHFTPEEYLVYERQSEFKSEYIGGEIVAMTGATRRHNLIVGNLFAIFHTLLKRNRNCEVYSNAMRVRAPPADLYTYPDVVAACGQPRFEDDELDTLLNPVFMAEVLSVSTESYDRGAKFVAYRSIPSFAEYLILTQDRVHVEHWVRQPDGSWVLTETDDLGASLVLSSVGCTVAIADVYDRVF